MPIAEVYLFTGPETGEKNEAIEKLREKASQKNGGIEEHKYYATDIRIEDIVSLLQNASLFSSALFMTIKNSEHIKLKSDIDILVSWIESASASPNTLILVSDENSIDKRIEKVIPATNKKVFWEMFEDKKQDWISSLFNKNGFSITNEAIDMILEMVENNTESLRTECSRFFFCFEKGSRIDVSDVEKILSHNREENAFTLFDSMSNTTKTVKARFENSLEILQKIRSSKESNGTALIAGLAYCFRQLRTWHTMHANGNIPNENEFKAAGFLGKRNREKYAKASRIWTLGETYSILALLSRTDMRIRETGAALEETYLSTLIYSIVIKNGLFCAEYETKI